MDGDRWSPRTRPLRHPYSKSADRFSGRTKRITGVSRTRLDLYNARTHIPVKKQVSIKPTPVIMRTPLADQTNQMLTLDDRRSQQVVDPKNYELSPKHSPMILSIVTLPRHKALSSKPLSGNSLLDIHPTSPNLHLTLLILTTPTKLIVKDLSMSSEVNNSGSKRIEDTGKNSLKI